MSETASKVPLRIQRLEERLERMKERLTWEKRPEKVALLEKHIVTVTDHLHLLRAGKAAAPEGLVISPPTGGMGITSPT